MRVEFCLHERGDALTLFFWRRGGMQLDATILFRLERDGRRVSNGARFHVITRGQQLMERLVDPVNDSRR